MILTVACMGLVGVLVIIPVNFTAQTPEYEIDAGINSCTYTHIHTRSNARGVCDMIAVTRTHTHVHSGHFVRN